MLLELDGQLAEWDSEAVEKVVNQSEGCKMEKRRSSCRVWLADKCQFAVCMEGWLECYYFLHYLSTFMIYRLPFLSDLLVNNKVITWSANILSGRTNSIWVFRIRNLFIFQISSLDHPFISHPYLHPKWAWPRKISPELIHCAHTPSGWDRTPTSQARWNIVSWSEYLPSRLTLTLLENIVRL